jgi:gephyrin
MPSTVSFYLRHLLQIQPTIDLALRYVPDLSENELIETLNVIVNHTSSQTSATDTDAMQVDSIPSTTLDQILSLPGFLATMLKYRQFTAPQLIAAFRHHLRSAEAVTSIVQLLDEWMKKVQSQDVKLLPSTKEITKNEHGVFIIKKDMVKPNSTHDLPTTAQVPPFSFSGILLRQSSMF